MRNNIACSCLPRLGENQATGNRIYVGNLAWTVEWQELKDHMRTVGKVVHADVLQDSDGRSKVGVGPVGTALLHSQYE